MPFTAINNLDTFLEAETDEQQVVTGQETFPQRGLVSTSELNCS